MNIALCDHEVEVEVEVEGELPPWILHRWSSDLDFLVSADTLRSTFFERRSVPPVYNTGPDALTENERAVTKFYVCLLDRLPDLSGLQYWASELDAGKSMDAIAACIFNGGYTSTIYGDIAANADFITAAYWHVLGRAPDTDGAAYWLGQMADASIASRLKVLQQFTDAALGAPEGSWENTFMRDRLDRSEEAVAQQMASDGAFAGDVLRIDCFGDSTTFGYDGAYGTRIVMPMPAVLQLQLNMQSADTVVVNNFGVNSTTAGDLLAGAAGHQPFASRIAASTATIVVFNFGLNEAYRGNTEASMHDALSELVRLAHAAGKYVMISTTNPVGEDISWKLLVPDMNATALQVVQETVSGPDDEYAYILSLPDWPEGLSDGVHPVQDLYETKGVELASQILQSFDGPALELIGIAA